MWEGLAFGCVGLFAVCVTFWLPIALIAIIGGIVGLFKLKGATWFIFLPILGVGILMILIFVRNEYFPEPYPTPEPVFGIADETVEPYFHAISQSERFALGFSPIPTEAEVMIQEFESSTTAYIFIDPDTAWGARTSWNIYFEKIGDIYKWAGESEVYSGPNPYENIYIHYFTDSISPGNYYGKSEPLPQNTLIVEYRGEDSRLIKPILTLSDVQPILIEWKIFWDTSETDK